MVLNKQNFPEDFLQNVAMIWWKPWRAQNAVVFENHHMNPQHIVIGADAILQSFLLNIRSRQDLAVNPTQPQGKAHQKPPQSGNFKITLHNYVGFEGVKSK